MASKTTSPQSGTVATQILFLLRFLQQGSLVLTGFIATYFVYWHNVLRDSVPIPLILLIATCAFTILESYTVSALSVSQHSTSPNYPLLLKTSTPCSLALALAYYALRQVPFVRKWCEGDDWFRPIRETDGYALKPAGVEEHHQALTCVAIVAGAVALGVTVLVSGFAGVGVVKERRTKRKGYAVVGEGSDEFEEGAYDLEDFEKSR